jgi:hypothetical protein
MIFANGDHGKGKQEMPELVRNSHPKEHPVISYFLRNVRCSS